MSLRGATRMGKIDRYGLPILEQSPLARKAMWSIEISSQRKTAAAAVLPIPLFKPQFISF